MKTVSITARFNGERILLDEALELEPNTKLIVTVLSGQDLEREVWGTLAERGLASAYADGEEEYSLTE